MRLTVINEPDDPAPQLNVIRTLGDKHARINPDYSEAKRVRDLRHILTASAKQSPYVTPSTYACSLVVVSLGSNLAFAIPAKDAGYSPPSGGGGEREKKPNINAVAFDCKTAYTTKPVGEWKTEPVGAMVKRWMGVGYPCILCFRMWGVTEVHPDTRGCCPYMCKEAFGSGRAPDTALPAGKRPPPPAFAAALASFQAPDCPAASPPVVPTQQADTPSDEAAMTFIAPPSDPSPQLAPLSPSTAGDPVAPAAEPRSENLSLHLACADSDEVPEDAALHGFAEDDFD
ncbi:hypothetical protein CYMTET_23484 [Cymbomonas tetramitiformis]|uniref:Uncharacterized protein n=1 Tax=Cymbomonas tetramitiformis TaxID=36881 RepID=A0AAE0FYJ4_9CHLO|nr:hypothetical protein CYMTET_23484 [Cymbomonas tetramitiformis]